MSEELTGESPMLKAWMLLHRTRGLIFKCEDRVFNQFGLTTEQYTVLLAIKCLDEPVRPTDIGQWLGHKVNSVSMIVDRMVKAGLVKRARDLPDRRALRLVITSKGEQASKPTAAAALRLIQEILSPLTDEDTHTLIRLLEMLRDKTYDYLDSGEVVEELRRNETENMAQFMKQAAKYESLSALGTKRQGSEKGRTI